MQESSKDASETTDEKCHRHPLKPPEVGHNRQVSNRHNDHYQCIE